MKKRVNKLSPKGDKSLSDEKQTPDESLIRVMEQIKAFCKVAYQLYSQKSETETNSLGKELRSVPPDQFTNAA